MLLETARTQVLDLSLTPNHAAYHVMLVLASASTGQLAAAAHDAGISPRVKRRETLITKLFRELEPRNTTGFIPLPKFPANGCPTCGYKP